MSWKRIQLGLIHAAVAMTLVPINSTLNRVMINELAISATLVAILASLPYLFSPIQVAIGSFSDRHPLLGWRRTPYIAGGLVLCVVGVVVLPRIAFLIADNFWLGLVLSLLAFGAWGMGYNLATVSYFSLATELSGKNGRSRTIAAMFFIMILSIILTAISLSRMLDPYTPEILVQSFAIVGGLALLLGLIGIVRLEPRTKDPVEVESENYSWGQITRSLTGNSQAVLFFIYLTLLLVAILGQDILLEPFAAEAFGMSVSATTRITSIWGTFFLIFLVIGGAADGRISKLTIARIGAWTGIAAFGLILLSGVSNSQALLYIGVVSLGAATGLSTVSNLSLMLDMTIPGSVGLFIGAWGMASAAARLIGNISSGAIRDTVTGITGNPVAGYLVVFGLEIGLLFISLLLLRRIDVSLFRKDASDGPDIRERVALAGDAG
ncbi:MAG: BCD family MFS transporter [Anaerolineales bacterium]|nr:BCD family MFS transporter [Anaerolineales bacterium]